MRLASIYLPKALPLTELPDERIQFALGMYGEGDFFTTEGCCRRVSASRHRYDRRTRTLRSGRAGSRACIRAARQTSEVMTELYIGYLGRESIRKVLANYGIGQRRPMWQLSDMPDRGLDYATFDPQVRPVSRSIRQ